MTNESLSLLVAFLYYLFFGRQRPRALQRHETEPRQHAHADVAAPLKLRGIVAT